MQVWCLLPWEQNDHIARRSSDDVLQCVAKMGNAGHFAGEDVECVAGIGAGQREAFGPHSRQCRASGCDAFFGAVTDEDGSVLSRHATISRRAAPEVVAADEPGDEGGYRSFVHRFGIAELLDVTLEHDRDAIAHAHWFFLVRPD